MTTAVSFSKMERVAQGPLGVATYRVEFNLSDSVGDYGRPPLGADPKEARSRLAGSLSIEIPFDQTGEAEVFAKAREVLHAALTRLADVSKPQPS